MSCERHRRVLIDVALGAPTPPELASHLDRCPQCRAALEREQRLVGRIDAEVQASLQAQPSVMFLPRMRQRLVESPAAPRRWLMFWLVPAAMGLLLASRIVVRRPAPAPIPEHAAVTESPLPPPSRAIPAPAGPEAARPATIRAARARPAARTGPEVLVPPAEREALRLYMRDLHSRRADFASLRTVGLETNGLRSVEMTPIDLAPIRIALIGVQPLTMESPNEE
jgi:hypothetical protein